MQRSCLIWESERLSKEIQNDRKKLIKIQIEH